MSPVSRRAAILAAALSIPAFHGTATAGQELTATIHRDAWGTPHVFSETDAGVVYGMAWALADDDWRLMEENYLHALGRYAELAGPPGLADDWMARALEIVPASVREYERSSPRIRMLLDAFAAGLNGWLAEQPTSSVRVLRRVEPWYPLALIRYKYYQTEFLGYAGLRDAWARRVMEQGWPDDVARYLEAQFGPAGRRPLGSNEWAVAPSRTAAGHALLLINPHQRFVGVQRYAEIHLDSREGLRFSGLTVFGFLLPYMGHNGRLGWAYTDNYADHSDLYAETFDAADHPLRYRYGEGYRTAESWVDSVRVRTGDSVETRTFRFVKTHHGPIVGIDDYGRPLAARLARFDTGGWFAQWDAMIRARSLVEWKAAVARLNVAYMNAMYADQDGNIGYVYGSAVPRRNPGVDPSGILDGSDPDTEWQGFHALDELPQVFNPPSGWLLNTNSTPFTATRDLPFDRDDFPTYMVGPETDNPRAQSSRRILDGMHDVTFDGFADRVWNSHLSAADRIVPELVSELRSLDGGDPPPDRLRPGTEARAVLEAVVERLAAWDGVADSASVETTWFVLMYERRVLAGPSADREGRPWLTSLDGALASLTEARGTREVPWGALNRHQRPLPGAPLTLDTTRQSLAVGGASGNLGSIFTYYSRPPASPGPRLGVAGNSFVKVMEFGPTVRARSVLNYGQSGDPESTHFFDQARLYTSRRFKPAWFTRADVVANAVETYVVPGGNH